MIDLSGVKAGDWVMANTSSLGSTTVRRFKVEKVTNHHVILANGTKVRMSGVAVGSNSWSRTYYTPFDAAKYEASVAHAAFLDRCQQLQYVRWRDLPAEKVDAVYALLDLAPVAK